MKARRTFLLIIFATASPFGALSCAKDIERPAPKTPAKFWAVTGNYVERDRVLGGLAVLKTEEDAVAESVTFSATHKGSTRQLKADMKPDIDHPSILNCTVLFPNIAPGSGKVTLQAVATMKAADGEVVTVTSEEFTYEVP